MSKHSGLILILAGCSGSDDVQKTALTSQKTTTIVWKMTGRVTPMANPLPQPAPFNGGQALVESCQSLPCAAEQWSGENGESVKAKREGKHYFWGTEKWPGAWRRLNGSLKDCLKDPLFYPPAQNSQNLRWLEWKKEPVWVLSLSGENPCQIKGELRLLANGSKIWTEKLHVNGKKWTEGGRELSRRNLLIHVSEQQTE